MYSYVHVHICIERDGNTMYLWLYKSTDKKVDSVKMTIIECNILYKKNRNLTPLILL